MVYAVECDGSELKFRVKKTGSTDGKAHHVDGGVGCRIISQMVTDRTNIAI